MSMEVVRLLLWSLFWSVAHTDTAAPSTAFVHSFTRPHTVSRPPSSTLRASTSLTSPPRRVAIVGAGTAGLALAVALRKLCSDHIQEVTVFDQRAVLQPGMGGGVQLNSGAAVLARLGLGPEVEKYGHPAKAVLSRNVAGEELLQLNLWEAIRSDPRSERGGLISGPNVRAVTMMRDQLQELLTAQLPEGTIQTGRKIERVSDAGSEAVCHFADGSTQAFDLVVGADGVNSVVRKSLGNDQETSYSGIRIQWGVAPGGVRPADSNTQLHQWFGAGAYCLCGTYGGVGGEMFDQCVVVFGDKSPTAENGGWEPTEVKSSMLRRLEAAGMPEEVTGLASKCDRLFELGLRDFNPLIPWSNNKNIVLMGDAAHCMPPFLGQGANQAIQDAYCLASQLSNLYKGGYSYNGRKAGMADALSAYEATRKPPTLRLAASSRLLGFVETGLPEAARDAFFKTTGSLGIARTVFLDGAQPKV